MHFLNQNRIEKIKTDRQYRRDLFHKKSNGLIMLIGKFSHPPTGELHYGVLRDICEIDYVLDFIRDIDYQDEITHKETYLGVDWEPFMGEFFKSFQKLPQPVSDRMMAHLVKSDPKLTSHLYKKLGIDIPETDNVQDLEKDENIFKKTGYTWTIRFKGKETTIKHSMGMKYIAYLLKHQGHEFSSMDLKRTLISDFELTDKSIVGKQEKTVEQNKNSSKAPEPMKAITKEELNMLNDSLMQKKKEYETAIIEQDKRKEDSLHFEINFIESHIRGFTDKDGKIRNIPDALEKARKSVWTVINTAKNNIKEHHKELFKHLDKYIRTGGKLIYTPKNDIYWNVDI